MQIKLSKISALQFFQIIRYSALLLVSIFVAKSSLGIENIGYYETLVLIGGSISFFWLNAIIKSFLVSYKSNEKGTFFSVFILMNIFSFLSLVLVKLIFASFEFNIEKTNVINLFYVYVFTIAPASLSEYMLLLKNKLKQLNFYGIFIHSLLIILISYVLYFYHNLKAVFYVLIFINIIKITFSLIIIWKYDSFVFVKKYIYKNLKLAKPLMYSFLLSGSAQYIDSFLVTWKFDASVFAIFKYGTKEFPLLIIFTDAFSNAILNDFSKEKLSTVLLTIKAKSEKYMLYFFPIFYLLLIFSDVLYKYFFSVKFEQSAEIFDIYLLIIVSRLTFPQTIANGIKDTYLIFKASLLEIIFNVLLSVTLLFIYGIKGVAFATVLAFYFEKFYLIVQIKKKHKITPNKYINVKKLFALSFLLFLIYIIKYTQTL